MPIGQIFEDQFVEYWWTDRIRPWATYDFVPTVKIEAAHPFFKEIVELLRSREDFCYRVVKVTSKVVEARGI